MATPQLTEHYHLSLSIGKSLWDDLVGAALPLAVAKGEFELLPLVYQQVKQLGVKERFVALLEDRQAPAVVGRVRSRAGRLWQSRREQVYGIVQEVVAVDGDWKFEIDREGTDFHYAPQKIGVDAHVRATVHGKAHLLRNNIEIPFTIEKRLGAACHLGDIHYDKSTRAVVGSIEQPAINLGEHIVLRLLNRGVAMALEQQAGRFGRIPILKKDQLEDLVAPAGGPLKLQMGVDDVAIEVSEENLTLKVRFGFKHQQLTA